MATVQPPGKAPDIARKIREAAGIISTTVSGDIGSFIVSRKALDKFLRIGAKARFWHLCHPSEVRALHENEGGTAKGYLFVDFSDKLGLQLTGEMAIAKCEGVIEDNMILGKVSRKSGDSAELLLPGSVTAELDGMKAELIEKTFRRKETIARFNEKSNDMPPMDYLPAALSFMSDYWQDSGFKRFAAEEDASLSGRLVALGDAYLEKKAEAVRSLFVSEPVRMSGYRMLELYATPNCRKYFQEKLPHMKVIHVSPAQFGLLRL